MCSLLYAIHLAKTLNLHLSHRVNPSHKTGGGYEETRYQDGLLLLMLANGE